MSFCNAVSQQDKPCRSSLRYKKKSEFYSRFRRLIEHHSRSHHNNHILRVRDGVKMMLVKGVKSPFKTRGWTITIRTMHYAHSNNPTTNRSRFFLLSSGVHGFASLVSALRTSMRRMWYTFCRTLRFVFFLTTGDLFFPTTGEFNITCDDLSAIFLARSLLSSPLWVCEEPCPFSFEKTYHQLIINKKKTPLNNKQSLLESEAKDDLVLRPLWNNPHFWVLRCPSLIKLK